MLVKDLRIKAKELGVEKVYTMKKVELEAAIADKLHAIAQQQNKKEVVMKPKVKHGSFTYGIEVNASTQMGKDGEGLPGKLVNLHKDGEDNFSISFSDCNVPIGEHTTLRKKAALSGKFTLISLKIRDPELRSIAIKLLIDELSRIGIKKYGKPLYPVLWHVDKSHTKGIVGHIEDLNELFGVDLFDAKYDPSKLIGYDAPARVEILSSTKDKYNILCLDIEGPEGEAYWDGIFYLNSKVKERPWVGAKDVKKGKIYKRDKTIGCAQFRHTEGRILKGLMACHPDLVHDACYSFDIDPTGIDGVMPMDTIKTNKPKSGETIEVNPTDVRLINMIKSGGTGVNLGESAVGVQMATHNPKVVSSLAEELEIWRKGQEYRKILDLDPEAAYKMLTSDEMKTMEDADIAPILFAGMAIPSQNGWHIPRFKSILDKYAARCTRYYQSHVLRLVTASFALYTIPCPCLIQDGDLNMRDALSVFEREWLEEYGEQRNFIVYPDDPETIRLMVAKDYLAAERHPVVGIGSIQNVDNLPLKYVDELQNSGFKSIYKREVDGVEYAVQPIRHGVMVSYDAWKAFNGDYDGDIMYFIPSDNCDFGAVRCVPVESEKGDKSIERYDHEIYPKYLKYKYQQVANSQPLIGLVDLLVRRVIEENRLHGHGLTKSQYMELAEIRELMIQGRKHLSADMDLDHPPTLMDTFTKIKNKILRRFHYKRELDKEAPITFKLKVFGSSGTGIRTFNSYAALRNIVTMTKEVKLQSNGKSDPWHKAWEEIAKGGSPIVVEDDSQYWYAQLFKLWSQLRQGDKELLGISVSKERMGRVEAFCRYLLAGKEGTPWKGYTNSAKSILARTRKEKDDYLRRTEFSRLSRVCKQKIEVFILSEVGEDLHKQDLLSKLLTIYLGIVQIPRGRFTVTRGFGTYQDVEGNKYSSGGGCFFMMRPKYLLWVIKIVHPNNPVIDKLIEYYKVKL